MRKFIIGFIIGFILLLIGGGIGFFASEYVRRSLLEAYGDGSEIRQNIALQDIRDTLKAQSDAWNNGNIDAFMQPYLQTSDLRFASGGKVTTGWQETLTGYKSRYPDKAAMGTLAFTDLDIKVLSREDALVFGRWELSREVDTPGGLFTLHFKNIDGQWVIISDHTSSRQSP